MLLMPLGPVGCRQCEDVLGDVLHERERDERYGEKSSMSISAPVRSVCLEPFVASLILDI